MNHSIRARRGQPLLVLGALLAGWVGLRAALWTPPFDIAVSAQERSSDPLPTNPQRSESDAPQATEALLRNSGEDAGNTPGAEPEWRLAPPLPGLIPAPLPERDLSTRILAPSSEPSRPTSFAYATNPASGEATDAMPRTRLAVGHALLTVMGLSQMELPRAMTAYLDMAGRSARKARLADPPGVPQAARGPARLVQAERGSPRRWSGDAWLLLREDSAQALAAGRPSYGRSQAGAVLRYRLAPSSAHRPQAYVRASSALESPRDAEVAAGVAARPLRHVPVRLAAELRVSDTQEGTKLRPTALAVSEFPPLDLPLGARGEAYVQGGYVGGEFDTPFIDGQLRVAREVARVGRTRITAGAGAWGGAQKGASRLDIGPSAAVSFRLGEVNSRLAVDYRVRVAGDAEPTSGPALTLSAGF